MTTRMRYRKNTEIGTCFSKILPRDCFPGKYDAAHVWNACMTFMMTDMGYRVYETTGNRWLQTTPAGWTG